MTFSAAKFEAFCNRLVIDTKEHGQVPMKWLGGQRYLVQEIERGLAEGIHTFVILKGRQMGISTVSLGLDLYWMFKHPGLQGAMVTDTDENKTLFRSNLANYLEHLPRNLKVPALTHNRTQLDLKNRSRLSYLVAGTRNNGNLGRGKAVNFMHATECSSWGDEEGLSSLYATLAQQNPHRLYLFESTARGYNMFYEMWKTAKESKTQRAIFVGWWRHEIYRCTRDSVEYRTYWDGAPTSDERVWIAEVFRKYGHSIDDEQIAWWRWYMAEQSRGDETLMMQEFPPTEDYAFQLSGSKFFSAERINQAYQSAIVQEPQHFRWKFGLHFEDTEFIETNEDMADMRLWEMPDERGVYVMGCDPAYGSSEWADEFVISIWRCYADRIVQVAEIATTEWTPVQYAWVMAHLGGFYRGAVLVLEINGPGGTVLNELHNLRRQAGFPSNATHRKLYDAVGFMRDYFYRRQDSITAGVALQWQTNAREKIRMLETLRSEFERERIVMNSPACVEQLRNIRRNGDQIGGEGRAHDDRVIAAALAVCGGWNDTVMLELQALGRTFDFEHAPRKEGVIKTPLEQNIEGFFKRQGIMTRFGRDS